ASSFRSVEALRSVIVRQLLPSELPILQPGDEYLGGNIEFEKLFRLILKAELPVVRPTCELRQTAPSKPPAIPGLSIPQSIPINFVRQSLRIANISRGGLNGG